MIMAGGWGAAYNILDIVDVLGKEDSCPIAKLPFAIMSEPSLFPHGNNILICGGNPLEQMQSCIEYNEGNWKKYNSLTAERDLATMVPMKEAVYIFGGQQSKETSEYLRHDNDTWQKGPDIPNGGLLYGCGVGISETKMLLIGGYDNPRQILMFNTEDNSWHSTSIKLEFGRCSHKCLVFNSKVIVTGGQSRTRGYLNSTEIIDFSGNEMTIRAGGDMNFERYNHGMGVITMDYVPTAIVFGGLNNLSNKTKTVQVWHDKSETWITSDTLDLNQPRAQFGVITVPTELVCP